MKYKRCKWKGTDGSYWDIWLVKKWDCINTFLYVTTLFKDGLITEYTGAFLSVTERHMAAEKNKNALTDFICNFTLLKMVL